MTKKKEFNPSVWNQHFESNSINDGILLHSLRTAIFKLKNPWLKVLFLDNAKKLMDGSIFIHQRHMYIHHVIRDLCLFKLQKTFKKPNTTFIVVDHVNRLVDKMNISRIFKTNDIKAYFPVKSDYYSSPSVSYSYSKTIRSAIVNYKETLLDPDHGNITCSCDKYPLEYVDAHHGHIVTGDINIVSNKDLRNILQKGLGYHDQQPCNKTVALKAIRSAIDVYINKISSTVSVPIVGFTAWKVEVMKVVEDKMKNIKGYKFDNILSKRKVKEELAKLKKDFVFVPVDKAGSNVSIVCKKIYFDIVTNEIEESTTFEMVSNDSNEFLHDLVTRFNTNGEAKLPFLYATTKMHKTPTKFRFITAGRDTLFSKRSIAVSKCLNLLMKTSKTSFDYRIEDLESCNFVIDSRDKVVEFLNNSNNNNEKKQISTWDFSTLYTKIPLDKLKEKVSVFVRKVYAGISKSKKADFITCSDKFKTAYFSKSKSKTNTSYSCDQLIQEINCIADNSYIVYHDKVYRQKIGIPMGTNCAPFFGKYISSCVRV